MKKKTTKKKAPRIAKLQADVQALVRDTAMELRDLQRRVTALETPASPAPAGEPTP